MAEEKVIHEVRIIETEDGFRIEIRGDKERIRRMGFARAIGIGTGRAHRRRHGRRRHGHRHHHGGGWGRGPRWWGEDTPEAEEETADAPRGV